jgi:hypothetical protein
MSFMKWVSITSLCLVTCAQTAFAVGSKCDSKKLAAAGTFFGSSFLCEAKAAGSGISSTDASVSTCIGKAQAKLDSAFTKASEGSDCSPGAGDSTSIATLLQSAINGGNLSTNIVLNLRPNDSANACAKSKLSAVGMKFKMRLSAFSKAAQTGKGVPALSLKKVEDRFGENFLKAEELALAKNLVDPIKNPLCLTVSDAGTSDPQTGIEGMVDGYADTVVSDLAINYLPTPTPIQTYTPTPTPTATNTPVFTNTPTFTNTPVPTNTFTHTPTPTFTNTPTPTSTFTDTPTPTDTATATNTPTFTNTPTPVPCGASAPECNGFCASGSCVDFGGGNCGCQ